MLYSSLFDYPPVICKYVQDVVDGRVENPPSGVEFLITPTSATNNAAKGLAALPTTDGEVGRGELNNAATWDEFINGRFGDFKSPAYGIQGLWGNQAISVRLLRRVDFYTELNCSLRQVTQ